MIQIYPYGEVAPEKIFSRVVPTVDVTAIVADIIRTVRAEGDAALYGRFGFKAGAAFGLGYHGLPAGADAPWFLAKELAPGYLSGAGGWVYHTPAGYFVSEEEAEAFDKAFAPKEKLALPGQLG